MVSMPLNFFAPFAMPFMAAYMLYQGATTSMGFYGVGTYEKRKIQAMSNDEFNALTMDTHIKQILEDMMTITKNMPPFFEETRKVNGMVIKELTFLWKDIVDAGLAILFQNPGAFPNQPSGPVANPDYVPEPDRFLPPPKDQKPDTSDSQKQTQINNLKAELIGNTRGEQHAAQQIIHFEKLYKRYKPGTANYKKNIAEWNKHRYNQKTLAKKIIKNKMDLQALGVPWPTITSWQEFALK